MQLLTHSALILPVISYREVLMSRWRFIFRIVKFASYLSIGAYIYFFKKTSTLNILTTKTRTTKTCYSQLPTANHNESKTTHYHMEKAHNDPLPHKNNNHTMTDNHLPPPRKIQQSCLPPKKVPLWPSTTYWHQESPITTHYHQ